MNELLDKKSVSAEILMVFAELYKPPTLEFWKEIKENKLFEKLERTTENLYGIAPVSLENYLPESLECFCSMYMSTIAISEKGTTLPIESLYKPWTQDETCTLPFAHSKGYLQGDSAMHIQFILGEFQIEIPLEYKGMPDHISILLELLAYFIEHAPNEYTAEFIKDHFDWLAEYETKLKEVPNQTFYSRVTRFLIEVIEAQRSEYL
ncbi:molecular chaperone TorD family protein [Mesobacillus subterraneus]|uniref:molecular chaperone TorD family protein n=1 Tax=Mesobacillus subterraneus TaxID=285983 RepID=UPI00203D4396|nr:molecular chaperone TorD family protein [Mesobacillus subterraneus]MCM3685464.1 molecular chaperone TorD family protein [Mesobacillus subterraneus]